MLRGEHGMRRGGEAWHYVYVTTNENTTFEHLLNLFILLKLLLGF